jgi:hypothetical protein
MLICHWSSARPFFMPSNIDQNERIISIFWLLYPVIQNCFVYSPGYAKAKEAKASFKKRYNIFL